MRVPSLAAAACILVLSGCNQTQRAEPSPPPSGRYEIVQFRRATGYTFKFDTWTGKVWQATIANTRTHLNVEEVSPSEGLDSYEGFTVWQHMNNACELQAPRPADVTTAPEAIQPQPHRFRIFLSDEVLLDSYVMDTATGKACNLIGRLEKPRGAVILDGWGMTVTVKDH